MDSHSKNYKLKTLVHRYLNKIHLHVKEKIRRFFVVDGMKTKESHVAIKIKQLPFMCLHYHDGYWTVIVKISNCKPIYYCIPKKKKYLLGKEKHFLYKKKIMG